MHSPYHDSRAIFNAEQKCLNIQHMVSELVTAWKMLEKNLEQISSLLRHEALKNIAEMVGESTCNTCSSLWNVTAAFIGL